MRREGLYNGGSPPTRPCGLTSRSLCTSLMFSEAWSFRLQSQSVLVLIGVEPGPRIWRSQQSLMGLNLLWKMRTISSWRKPANQRVMSLLLGRPNHDIVVLRCYLHWRWSSIGRSSCRSSSWCNACFWLFKHQLSPELWFLLRGCPPQPCGDKLCFEAPAGKLKDLFVLFLRYGGRNLQGCGRIGYGGGYSWVLSSSGIGLLCPKRGASLSAAGAGKRSWSCTFYTMRPMRRNRKADLSDDDDEMT